MPPNREQIEQLVAAAPSFRNRWEGFLREWEGEEAPPWFAGISELAHYIVENYARGVTVEFPSLFGTVEAILQNPDPEVENLIAVGLFEDMQNIASHRDFGAIPFRRFLGPRSLVVWDEVDANMKRVAAWEEQNKPRWWQFWRRRSVFDANQALAQVENPDLRKIIEANYRKMR
ncbi:MAG TPA: hypothetical protein VE263_19340 [Candidatus Angelobacter sp.]|nr:hypothetical protein [Candidatus Angelobacter sp.]